MCLRSSNVFSLNNHILEKVKCYKYLGIWFTKKGKFHVAKEHLANQANKGMFSLLTILRHFRQPPIPVILQLYETMLKPILCYNYYTGLKSGVSPVINT